MAKLHEVYGIAAPDDLYELNEGTHILHAPFFDSDDAEGGALQVGLPADQNERSYQQDVIATIRNDAGHRAIELVRADGKPFTVESHMDSGDNTRVDALGRAIAKLVVEDSLKAWMNVEADGDEPIEARAPEGLNRFVQNVALFALIQQRRREAAEQAAAQNTANTLTRP